MHWYHRLLALANKYRGEIVISLLSAIVGVALGKVADVFMSAPSLEQLQIGLLVAVLFFIGGHAFMIKRNVISRVVYLQDRVGQLIGRGLPTQYDERKLQFPEEKGRLVEHLVRTELSIVVNKLFSARPGTDFEIALLIDSGTTLEPLFPRIKVLGLNRSVDDVVLKKLEIYTNSLSGSDAFCREPGSALHGDQLHLFGGVQMEKYRAVTGDVTLKAMDAVRDEYRQKCGVIIGLITANWFLVGGAYDKLVLCSSERGHLDYKRRLAEIADELIVVTPLGKLLRLDTSDELNRILRLREEGKPEYEGFSIKEISRRNRENTRLLTTYRNWKQSILYVHSQNLRDAAEYRKHSTYTLCDRSPSLALDHRVSTQKQKEIEMPHAYLHAHSQQALQIP